jgi:formate dehydrogenase maturation protein FdhE
MLQFCIRIEYYELCSEIESYIKNMDKRKRRNVKKVVREFATI